MEKKIEEIMLNAIAANYNVQFDFREAAKACAEIAIKLADNSFVAGRSKISWEDFKKEIYKNEG